VYAWDWEHSTSCAPWGFDLLHWQITVPVLRHGVRHRDSAAAAARSALLPGVSIPRRTLVLAYLVEMGLRMLQLNDAPVDVLRSRGTAEARPHLSGPTLCRGSCTCFAGREVSWDVNAPVLAQELRDVATVVMAGDAR
jgi:hypothetical protein